MFGGKPCKGLNQTTCNLQDCPHGELKSDTEHNIIVKCYRFPSQGHLKTSCKPEISSDIKKL